MNKDGWCVLREVVRNLRGSISSPWFDTPPELEDGIVWFGSGAAMHPSSFLYLFGEEKFLAMKSDIPKKLMKAYVKECKAKP